MRYCSNCGTQNENDAKFCSGCGTKLDSAPAAPVEEAVQDVAPSPIPVPTEDFAQQAAPQDFVRAAEPQAPQFEQAPQQPQQPYGQASQYGQAPQQPQYGGQPQQYAPQGGYVPYSNTVAPTPQMSAKCRTFGIISFVLGIASLVLCWFGLIPYAGIFTGIFSLACSIVGLIFSGISRREGNFKLAKLGKIFSIIGLVLTVVLMIIGIIILAAGLSSGDYYFY